MKSHYKFTYTGGINKYLEYLEYVCKYLELI